MGPPCDPGCPVVVQGMQLTVFIPFKGCRALHRGSQQDTQRPPGFSQRRSVATTLDTPPALPSHAKYAFLQGSLSDTSPLHDWHLSAN